MSRDRWRNTWQGPRNRPSSRVWDVACAARLWAPLRPSVYISDTRRGHEFRRFRLFVDSYGMNDLDRLEVADGVRQNYIWFYDLIKDAAASGHAGFHESLDHQNDAARQLTMKWHAENQANLRAALGVEPIS